MRMAKPVVKGFQEKDFQPFLVEGICLHIAPFRFFLIPIPEPLHKLGVIIKPALFGNEIDKHNSVEELQGEFMGFLAANFLSFRQIPKLRKDALVVLKKLQGNSSDAKSLFPPSPYIVPGFPIPESKIGDGLQVGVIGTLSVQRKTGDLQFMLSRLNELVFGKHKLIVSVVSCINQKKTVVLVGKGLCGFAKKRGCGCFGLHQKNRKFPVKRQDGVDRFDLFLQIPGQSKFMEFPSIRRIEGALVAESFKELVHVLWGIHKRNQILNRTSQLHVQCSCWTNKPANFLCTAWSHRLSDCSFCCETTRFVLNPMISQLPEHDYGHSGTQ
ncbi:MAG: hypothetical protein DDT19_02535 [Syntrophomonadaceae bacterium]|nr:hypothetical protein [Bacillota bacterium]